MEELILKGKIDSEGTLLIYGMRDVEKFKDKINKESKGKGGNVIVTIQSLPSNSTERRIAYIYAKIIPEFTKAMKLQGERYTKYQVEQKINEISVVAEYGKLNFVDMDFHQLGEFIDELKQIAAEHYSFYIDDSIVI